MQSDTVSQIEKLIGPVLEELGVELVEVQLRNEQIGLVLRVIIHKDEGVTLEDCRQVSREVSYLLEIEDPIVKSYHLEVSSPGLDRPLKIERDYARNIGKKISIFCGEDDPSEMVGRLESVKDGEIGLLVDGVSKKILLEKIDKAKLVIEF